MVRSASTIAAFLLATSSLSSLSQQFNGIEAAAEPGAVREMPLEGLPPAPEEFAKLIRNGKVRFVTGGEPSSTADTRDRPARLDGETRFSFQYRYGSRANWQVVSPGQVAGTRVVEIRVRFRWVKLLLTHEVWLRNPPDSEEFWKAPIVRHELDHVRISSDPRIESRFRDKIKQIERLRVPFRQLAGVDGRVDQSEVHALVESEMKQALRDTTEFVQIRYRELDRLTRHGMLPIPDDSNLFEPPPSASSDSERAPSDSE